MVQFRARRVGRCEHHQAQPEALGGVGHGAAVVAGRRRDKYAGAVAAPTTLDVGQGCVDGTPGFEGVRHLERFELEAHVGARLCRQPRRLHEGRPSDVGADAVPGRIGLREYHRSIVRAARGNLLP